MQGLLGLRSQSVAGSLLLPGRGMSRGMLPLLGLPSSKKLALSAAPPDISRTGENGTAINSGLVTITQKTTRRAEAFRQQWRQISGLPGVVMPHPDGVYFQHSSLPYDAASSFIWRCMVDNNFGVGGQIDVAFTLTTYTPIPPLSGSYSPTSQTFVYIEPVSRVGRCYFSAAGSGGVPPYTYDWGGGYEPTSASNYADIYLPPGASSGINFGPGCTIKDSIGQSVVVGPAGPFFVLEA